MHVTTIPSEDALSTASPLSVHPFTFALSSRFPVEPFSHFWVENWGTRRKARFRILLLRLSEADVCDSLFLRGLCRMSRYLSRHSCAHCYNAELKSYLTFTYHGYRQTLEWLEGAHDDARELFIPCRSTDFARKCFIPTREYTRHARRSIERPFFGSPVNQRIVFDVRDAPKYDASRRIRY